MNQWIKNGVLRPVRAAGAPRFRPEDVRVLFEKEDGGKRSARILAIDDDPLVGRSLKILLERAGYQTQIAAIGLAALDAVSSEDFDLILTDIRMPGMNGLETLKAIRELRRRFGKPSIPEIIITAFEDEGVREEAGRMGVRGFLLKPFELKTLLTAIEKNLRKGKRAAKAHAF